MNRHEHARSHLKQWEAAKPRNFYHDDDYFRAALRAHLSPDSLARAEPALGRAGADAAGPISQACAVLERPESLPRLEQWTSIGERADQVVYHPVHHEAGRLIWGSGIVSILGEPGNVTLHGALTYLFAMNGESAHLCSVGCAAGLVKAIQRCGSDWMRRQWLPHLLDPAYDTRWDGAQFLTEVQGGSDVGANTCVARKLDNDGRWTIHGEKWFCSNVAADLCAVTARPEGAGQGTGGLAVFVIPRRLEDGRLNGMSIRRLKNKLGMRSLPTGEVDFHGAVGYQLGSLDDGFKLMMGVIINTSRLGIGAVSAGVMRRAYVEALHFARARMAFGRRLVEFAAVRQQLAEMRALGVAGLAFTLFVAALEDRLTRQGLHPEDDPLFRSAINVNKYVSSIDAARVVRTGMEILGGNGMIEDFSVLPRLYREMPIHEIWEGPPNTLMAQIYRDAVRSRMHEALLARTEELWGSRRHPALARLRDQALAAVDEVRNTIGQLLGEDPERGVLHMRAVMCRMARLFQASLLADGAEQEVFSNHRDLLIAMARWLLHHDRLEGYAFVGDKDYPELIDEFFRDTRTGRRNGL
jgi:acyl-CoA dehydrogenase